VRKAAGGENDAIGGFLKQPYSIFLATSVVAAGLWIWTTASRDEVTESGGEYRFSVMCPILISLYSMGLSFVIICWMKAIAFF
jgi:hypothetical protein